MKRQAKNHLPGKDHRKDDKPTPDGFRVFGILIHPVQISAISEIRVLWRKREDDIFIWMVHFVPCASSASA